MDETLFYVFGLGLVVSAVAVSAVGLRFEGFPAIAGGRSRRDRLLRRDGRRPRPRSRS